MPRFAIATAKFVGSVSLGLLTGLSYTLANITIPPLLHLPAAEAAHSTFNHILASSRAHLRALSILSSSSLLLAYALSPRRARHPYLVWTAAMVGLSSYGNITYFCATGKPRSGMHTRRRRSVYEEVSDVDVNGERLEKAMEDFQFRQTVRTVVVGLGFLMNIVGIWGDGY
ncbi:MAG: hypothetical protein M1839_008491 [Geoglossum umbratile]|nr:MAG: hypothetical protein M1839_008491 [Geoglossum umbratile]